jgi:molybdenum transport protein
MYSLPPSFLDRLLAEDVPNGDLTTLAFGIGGMPGVMEFHARGDMVLAGIEIAADMIRRVGADASTLMPSGSKAKAGTLLLAANGPAAALHHSWKAAQTLTEIFSGIATATRALVDAVEAVDANVRVACTRKTVPGARQLSVIAIRAGGAVSHRLGLSETILVFPEHRVFLPGLSLKDMAARLCREAPEKKLAIEVTTVPEAREAIEAGFDIIQLEKMTPDEVSSVKDRACSDVLLAAAGGITPANAGDYVRAGAGLIVSSWPYTAKPADVAVTIKSAEQHY